MVESSPYILNERVDCLDTFHKWCDASIIQIQDEFVLVTYTGYSDKYNEWI